MTKILKISIPDVYFLASNGSRRTRRDRLQILHNGVWKLVRKFEFPPQFQPIFGLLSRRTNQEKPHFRSFAGRYNHLLLSIKKNNFYFSVEQLALPKIGRRRNYVGVENVVHSSERIAQVVQAMEFGVNSFFNFNNF